jgi:uncharacterized protein YegJ (DUF2314 family)
MRGGGLALAYLLDLLPGFGTVSSGVAEDKVISVADDDKDMNNDILRARSSLPAFWDKFAKPESDEAGFAVKLWITDGKNTEHFWCGQLKGDATKASCAIDNEPQTVFTVKAGQRVKIDPAQISDWMYQKNGKIKGGQTIRALLPKLPEAEAAQYRAMLAEE